MPEYLAEYVLLRVSRKSKYQHHPTSTIPTIPTSTISASTTAVTPPGPTQSGIPANCNKYALAQDQDGCETFAAKNGIALEQLCKSSFPTKSPGEIAVWCTHLHVLIDLWNPILNNKCEK